MISTDLVRKLWTACGYPTEYQRTCSKENTIVVYDYAQVGNTVDRICGEDAHANFGDLACGPDPHFTSDDECSSDDEI